MAFRKGHKKVGGRKKGTPNRITQSFREKIEDLINDNWDTFNVDLRTIDSKSRVAVMIRLLEYVAPKMSKVEFNNSPNIDYFLNMADEERDKRIAELESKLND